MLALNIKYTSVMFFLMLSQLSQLFRPHPFVINFTMLIPQVQDKYMIVNQLFVFFAILKKLMFCITGIVRLNLYHWYCQVEEQGGVWTDPKTLIVHCCE